MKPGHPLLFLFVILMGWCCNQRAKEVHHNELQPIYDNYGVKGTFILYDENGDTYHYINESGINIACIPASTFKICNSLIGLESGVIPQPDHILPWDSVSRSPAWDRDHDLKTAYRNSTVWYYQELARRVGEERMSEWVSQANYGNQDISGGIDLFWLTGALRITPLEQVEFLQRLQRHELPFSDETIMSVKEIMIEEQEADSIRRAKTGWATQGDLEIGWYVGYIETSEKVYYFANRVEMDSEHISDPVREQAFIDSRKEIALKILDEIIL